MTKEAFLKESLKDFFAYSLGCCADGCWDEANEQKEHNEILKSWLTEIINKAWEGGKYEGYWEKVNSRHIGVV